MTSRVGSFRVVVVASSRPPLAVIETRAVVVHDNNDDNDDDDNIADDDMRITNSEASVRLSSSRTMTTTHDCRDDELLVDINNFESIKTQQDRKNEETIVCVLEMREHVAVVVIVMT